MIIFNTIKKAEHYVKFCNKNHDYYNEGYDWSTQNTYIEGNLVKIRSAGDGCGCGCDHSLYDYTQVIGSNVQTGTAYVSCAYYISKDAGSFRINHPDPAKTNTHLLYHSFVESPTAGDNIYRYEIQTCNGQASLELPSYYKFLNKNDQVWVTPVNHFGNAYGVIDQTQSCVSFCSDTDGKYMALIIGTRKDKQAQGYWNGVERIKNTMTHSTDIGLT
jgi:hypothetical protein